MLFLIRLGWIRGARTFFMIVIVVKMICFHISGKAADADCIIYVLMAVTAITQAG